MIKALTSFRFLENQKINRIFPVLFILIGLLGAFNHVLWRDEMQGWLVAWRSDSWIELWQNNAPSGHPVLWSALIFLVKGLTGSPLSMQLLHWALGSMAILVFWKWSPFKAWQKILFTFGYFPFWEYFFISRHYVLAELLIFVFCSSYSLRRKTYIPSAICIGLLTNTHAFSWSIAFAILVTLAIEWFTSPAQREIYKRNRNSLIDFFSSLFIGLSLSAFSAFSLLQVRDSVDPITSLLDLRHLLRVFGRIFGGYLLVIPNYHRWLDLVLCAFISVIMIGLTILFLKKSKAALVFFLSGTTFLFLFNYFIYLGIGSRHYGYYFLILIASIWLASDHESEIHKTIPNTFQVSSLSKKLGSAFNILFTISLTVHFFAGIHRTLYDFQVPYSAGKATANYITNKGWQNEEIFATRDVEVSTVAGYLDRDFYYPEIKDYGSYAEWDRRESLTRDQTLNQIQLFFDAKPDLQKSIILLSRRSSIRQLEKGGSLINGSIKITYDNKFEKSWTYPEKFYLYWAERL